MAKNCILYDKYFLDDLYSYKYNYKTSKIDYFVNDSSDYAESSNVDMGNTIKFIEQNIYKVDKDIWHPVFLTKDNSPIYNTTIYRGTTSPTSNIGIEDAVSIFDPKFNKWEMNEFPFMSTDWILTSDLCPFYPEYGLMFWFKENSLKDQSASIDNFPIGSNLKLSDGTYKVKIDDTEITLDNNLIFIKHDINTLLISDEKSILYVNTEPNFIPSNKYRYIKINDIISSSSVTRENIKFKLLNEDTIISSSPNISLWIPYGDTYSYFKSPIGARDIQRQEYLNNSCSSSFLSPVLSNIYREIYNIISSQFISRDIKITEFQHIPEPPLSPLQSKLIKKLCHLLATCPLLDRTTVSMLRDDAIYGSIAKYRVFKPIGIEDEIKFTKKILIEITKRLNELSTDYKTNYQDTYSNGFISTRTDLFNKLIHKYGSKLKLTDKSILKYKDGLPYGPHIKINQDITSKCSNSLFNQTVYNNMHIKAGLLNIKTNFDNTATKLILSHSSLPDQKTTIPLWDIEKVKLENIRIPISAGPDIDIDFGDQDISSIKEVKYDFITPVIDYNGKYDTTIIGAEEPDILWRRIAGPDCIRFGGANQPTLRYETSSDSSPTIYVKSPGKYVLEVRVRTSFSTIYDNIIIHVNGNINDKENKTIIKSYNRKKIPERLRSANVQYIEAKNNLKIIVPNIRECYIGKQGIFWPSYTDCSVKIPQGIADRTQPLGQGNSLPQAVIPLGNNYHKFAIAMPKDKKDNKIIENFKSNFSITYECNNTIIELNRITLTHLLDTNPKCHSCESLYEGIIDNNGFIIDGLNADYAFVDPSNNDSIVNVLSPDVLTTKPFAVQAYGGFSKNELSKINISIPNHPAPGSYLTNISTTGEFLNSIKGDDNKVTKVCHDTELPLASTIEFKKGCFHPYVGWTDDFKNLSSVVNFDPYNRATQVFKGPGMYDLYNSFEDGKTKIYRSSITLKVDPVAYDPVDEEAKDMESFDKREMSDHNNNYGYRSLAGDNTSLKNLNYNDEFILDFALEDDNPVSSSDYCSDAITDQQYSASYTFTRPGSLIPYKQRKKIGSKRLRWNRDGGSSIGNIEVKMNFLNYINPKQLVVWLEINPCAFASERLNPPPSEDGKQGTPKDPWFKDSYYDKYNELSVLPDNPKDNIFYRNIKTFLASLWEMNDNIALKDSSEESYFINRALTKPYFSENPKVPRDSVYRIYLLNQEHIENYEYNINIKFSDILDLYKNASNNNIDYDVKDNNILYINNHVSSSINNTIDLAPTLAAAGYKDQEIAKYKKIIIENKLLNNSHRFRKIIGMPIFSQGSSAKKQPGNSSQTTFTLCVAVTDESDIFEPYDRVLATQEMSGFETCLQKNRSSLAQNSLCNWELIIHKTENSNGFIPGDSLGNIKYEDQKPSIPGYSFIADLTDHLHLLPPSVLNAPNSYMIDGRLCRYSKENLNIPKFSQPLPLVISPLLFMLPPSVLGAVAALPGIEMAMNEQSKQIVNYLNAIRQQQQQEAFNKEWYVPNYDRYPLSSSDKILLSISKDNSLFYKTEASIFRYSNSIVMKKPSYNFFKLHYNSYLRNLSLFKINNIKEIQGLSKLFPSSLDFTKINIFKDILYYLYGNDTYGSYNNIFDLIKNTTKISTLIEEKKIYLIDGLRPYYFFQDHKDIVELKQKETKDIDQTKLKQLNDRLIELKKAKSDNTSDYDPDEYKNIENEIFLSSYEIINNKILNIGYILFNNSYKTILILENEAKGQTISVSAEKSKRIIILDNNNTTIDNKSQMPLNHWSLDNQYGTNNFTSENINRSAWGIGNYGYGSNLVTKFLLSTPDINSQIIPLKDRLDYQKNSYTDFNTAQILLQSSQETIYSKATTSSLAFTYTINDLNNNNKIYEYDNQNFIPALTGNMKNEIDKVYQKLEHHTEITEINMVFDENNDKSDKGIITFDKDLYPIKTYKLSDKNNLTVLRKRLLDLPKTITEQINKINSTSNVYIKELNGPISEKDKEINILRKLYTEKNNIEFYLDKLNTGDFVSIPNITVDVIINEDKSISITEKENKNLFWINIDPEQGCSIDRDRTPKILVSVRYNCIQYNDSITSNADAVCLDVGLVGPTEGSDESFTNYGNFTEYKLSDKSINSFKAKYSNLKWPENNISNYIVERKFFLNFHGKERAQQIIGKYQYLCPIAPSEPDVVPDGSVSNKVHDICNLDNNNTIYVDFKRIPRLLRNKDTSFDMYKPNRFGELTKTIIPSPGGPIDGSFRIWKCLDAKTGQYTPAPNPYFQWLNEMLFRTYFGSSDGVEHKGRPSVQSKDETYWVPYDYS